MATADGFLADDFLREARLLAEDLVGRKAELRKVKEWIKGRDVWSGEAARVGWIAGGPGLGKSLLVARVVSDLSNADTAKQGLFYHRFRAGDVRNSRRSFLRLLQAGLCAWEPLRELTKVPPDDANEGEKLLNDVKARLAMVGEIPAPMPRTSQPRFLIFADGLDELAAVDADFPALVKDLALPGVLWVVAGRAEHGLRSAFEAAGCESVFGTEGLPMMSASDIREMLETGLGNARYALLRRDREAEGGIRNAFVERVIGQAEGLPLYIYLLLEDLRQGHLTVNDESKLPHGLVAYYDELMNRVGLSTVKHDLSLAVCLLAKACEPLDGAGLALLAADGVAAAERLGRGGRIERALRSGRALLRLAPTPDGIDGWTLYHQSFREYVAGRAADPERGISSAPPATALADLVREGEDRLVQAADWWAELPRGNLRNHLFRQGVGYALAWGGSAGIEAGWRRLTNFAYLMARTEALRLTEIPQLTQDYAAALKSLASEGRQELTTRSPSPTSGDLPAWEKFFRSTAHVIGRANATWPAERIMLQCACDYADSSPITRAAEAWIASYPIGWKWLRLQNRPSEVPGTACLQTFEGHEVSAVSIHPDGTRAISGGRGTLAVWDIQTGACIRTLIAHADWVRAIVIHPDGRRAISAGDRTLKVWDIETGACIRVLEGHTWSVGAVIIHPDGRRAISGSGDIRIWDLDSGACLRTLEGDLRGVIALAVVQNGQHLISASTDHMIKSWNLESGECLHTVDRNTSWDTIMAIHPDGQRAISADFFGPLMVWDIRTGECVLTLHGHKQRVNSVAIHPDGRSILSGSQDKTLKLWNLEAGICIKTIEVPVGWDFKVAFHPDGLRVMSGSGDKTLKLWDLDTEGSASGIQGDEHDIVSAAIRPNGHQAISARVGENPTLWELSGGKSVRSFDVNECHHVEAIAIDPKGERALMACGHGPVTLKLIDLESGACVRIFQGHEGQVTALAIYPDGRRAISASDHFILKLWDLESGECLRTFWEQPTVVSMTIHPDARHAIIGKYDGSLEMRDMEAQGGPACVRVFDGPGGWLSSVALDVEGKRVACARRRSIHMWEVETGSLIARWEGDGTWIKACSLPPSDPRQLIALDRSGAVLWLRLMG